MSDQITGGLDLGTVSTVADQEDVGHSIALRGPDDTPLVYENGTGETRSVTMRIVGSYSHTYRRAQERERAKALSGRRLRVEAEELADHQIALEAACVQAWDGVVANGQPVPLNVENVTTLLKAAPWIRFQVQEAINDHAAFFRVRSTS